MLSKSHKSEIHHDIPSVGHVGMRIECGIPDMYQISIIHRFSNKLTSNNLEETIIPFVIWVTGSKYMYDDIRVRFMNERTGAITVTTPAEEFEIFSNGSDEVSFGVYGNIEIVTAFLETGELNVDIIE